VLQDLVSFVDISLLFSKIQFAKCIFTQIGISRWR
jgi:hypothetical protein